VTKNKEKRTIPLNQTVLKLLKDKSRIVSISGYVFVSESGTRIDASNLRRAFNSAEQRAGIEDFRFHDLRHTFATRLVQAGVDLYVVKQLLGHKSITMTMRYAHHYPESLRSGVEVLDKNYNSATMEKTKDLRQAVSP
jgi:integrase